MYFSEKDLIKNNIQLSAQHTSQFYLNISFGIYGSNYVDFMHACENKQFSPLHSLKIENKKGFIVNMTTDQVNIYNMMKFNC